MYMKKRGGFTSFLSGLFKKEEPTSVTTPAVTNKPKKEEPTSVTTPAVTNKPKKEEPIFGGSRRRKRRKTRKSRRK